MSKNKTLESLIDIAIAREVEAHDFYAALCSRADNPGIKETLKFLADEETRHKEFLTAYRSGKFGKNFPDIKSAVNYKIAEHADAPDLTDNINRPDIYLTAAHKELEAYNFYISLSEMHPEGEVKQMLLKIAYEELKHKEKVEYLYSNTAFPQTEGG